VENKATHSHGFDAKAAVLPPGPSLFDNIDDDDLDDFSEGDV